jgi:hypothetical protein
MEPSIRSCSVANESVSRVRRQVLPADLYPRDIDQAETPVLFSTHSSTHTNSIATIMSCAIYPLSCRTGAGYLI